MITISSYEPGNRTDSVTGTKFVVCVYTVNSPLTDTLVSRQLYSYIWTLFSIAPFTFFHRLSYGNNSRGRTALLTDTFPIPEGVRLRDSWVSWLYHDKLYDTINFIYVSMPHSLGKYHTNLGTKLNGYWPRWFDNDAGIGLRIYGPRRSRGP